MVLGTDGIGQCGIQDARGVSHAVGGVTGAGKKMINGALQKSREKAVR